MLDGRAVGAQYWEEKMKRELIISITISFLLFTSCVTTGFSDFFDPWYDIGYFPEEAYL